MTKKSESTAPSIAPEPKLPPSQIPAEWTPGFKPAPIPANSSIPWWPYTPRYLRVFRNTKTGAVRLDSVVGSLPDAAKIQPGTKANIADHEVMMVVDLVELLNMM